MTTCRMCTQNYPSSQFVSGNGPRYQVCVRCAVENDLVDAEEVPQLYSDDLAKSRLALFGRRYRLWFFIGVGMIWIASILLIALLYPDAPRLLVLASLVYPALYIVLSLWLDRQTVP